SARRKAADRGRGRKRIDDCLQSAHVATGRGGDRGAACRRIDRKPPARAALWSHCGGLGFRSQTCYDVSVHPRRTVRPPPTARTAFFQLICLCGGGSMRIRFLGAAALLTAALGMMGYLLGAPQVLAKTGTPAAQTTPLAATTPQTETSATPLAETAATPV